MNTKQNKQFNDSVDELANPNKKIKEDKKSITYKKKSIKEKKITAGAGIIGIYIITFFNLVKMIIKMIVWLITTRKGLITSISIALIFVILILVKYSIPKVKPYINNYMMSQKGYYIERNNIFFDKSKTIYMKCYKEASGVCEYNNKNVIQFTEQENKLLNKSMNYIQETIKKSLNNRTALIKEMELEKLRYIEEMRKKNFSDADIGIKLIRNDITSFLGSCNYSKNKINKNVCKEAQLSIESYAKKVKQDTKFKFAIKTALKEGYASKRGYLNVSYKYGNDIKKIELKEKN